MLVFGHKIQGVFKHKIWVFKEYSEQVYFVLQQRRFRKICARVWNLRLIPELLWYNTLFPIRTKIQGVFIIFKHFQQKFLFSRTFQAPLKSKIKFQGFSRTSRSSTNPEHNITNSTTERHTRTFVCILHSRPQGGKCQEISLDSFPQVSAALPNMLSPIADCNYFLNGAG